MTYKFSPRRLTAMLGVALLACDPGFTIDVAIIVPNEVAAAYTPTQRGLLVVSIHAHDYDTERDGLAIVCGEGGSYSASLGGLGTPPETDIVAWITPLPADDERPCGDVEFTERAGLDAPDVSEEDPQASETIAGGGGRHHVDLTLTAP